MRILRHSLGYFVIAALFQSHLYAVSDMEIARMMSQGESRQAAILEIVANRTRMLPVLLAWTNEPPRDLDVYEFRIGLADVFGALKAQEGIPFLVRNIGLDRTGEPNTWIKNPRSIKYRLPAVGALIEIGRSSIPPLIAASWEPLTQQDRRAVIFAISQIETTRDEAQMVREFLTEVVADSEAARYWASVGLLRLPTK